MGLIAGWLIARITIPAWPYPLAVKRSLAAFWGMIFASFLFSLGGWALASQHSDRDLSWKHTCQMMGVQDDRAFYQVAFIHAGSYLGAIAGLILAVGYLIRQKHSQSS